MRDGRKTDGDQVLSFEHSAGSRSGGARTALIAQKGRSSPATLSTAPQLALREKSRREEGEGKKGGYCDLLSRGYKGLAAWASVDLASLPRGIFPCQSPTPPNRTHPPPSATPRSLSPAQPVRASTRFRPST